MTERWSPEGRETAYTLLCEAITTAGTGGETSFLARLALMLAEQVADLDRVRAAIDAAARS